ncbi:beta-lactamase family protein [Belnapia sp. T6]|uniref:Beta-lactamase family protein n=1 Tax=Belnapia mucosa TaxID=2804532 RepID=A0ABS1VGJ4_9PROT|nr:serine hydrolase domain-containing protein [Belnapia mucosa]MBL6459548.1 beta-lactamase family protein [Belnapia mucosa]
MWQNLLQTGRHSVRALHSEVVAGRLPGAVLAVARRGHLVLHEVVGYLGPDQGTPMPLDAIFAIASMTKPIVGVAALMLREEGRLGLADPVERYLPQLGNRRVAKLSDQVLSGEGQSRPLRPSVRSRSRT